jgi:hypothetical protein
MAGTAEIAHCFFRIINGVYQFLPFGLSGSTR